MRRALRSGEFRISTLLDDHREEALGSAIGDDRQGQTGIYDEDPCYGLSELAGLPVIAHDLFHIRPAPQDSSVRNLSLVLSRQSRNYYLFCTSTTPSRPLLDELEHDAVQAITSRTSSSAR